MTALLLACALSHAADLDLGVGLRTYQPATDAAPWAAQLTARVGFLGHFAVEATGFVRLPFDPVKQRDRTMVAIAYAGDVNSDFHLPVDRELFGGTLLFEASPWARRRSDAVTVWGYAAVGGTLGLVLESDLVIPADVTDEADPAVLTPGYPDRVPAPAIGLGVETWFGRRLGVRTLALFRPEVRGPTYGSVTANVEPPSHALVLSLDLLVGL